VDAPEAIEREFDLQGGSSDVTARPRYDGLSDWYDREIRELQVTTTALQTLSRLVGAGPGTCLDLGCGTGVAIPWLLQRSWRVVGVDLSGDQLRVARQRAAGPGVLLVTANAVALPFADRSFDAVVSVLTHTDLDDPEAAFAESARVLRRGGRLSYVGTHPCFVTPFVERRAEAHLLRLSAAWLAPRWSGVRPGDPSQGRRASSDVGRPDRRRAGNRAHAHAAGGAR
jgi:ubiquinone/menaquinone biosynthesis C-methylase UbiE